MRPRRSADDLRRFADERNWRATLVRRAHHPAGAGQRRQHRAGNRARACRPGWPLVPRGRGRRGGDLHGRISRLRLWCAPDDAMLCRRRPPGGPGSTLPAAPPRWSTSFPWYRPTSAWRPAVNLKIFLLLRLVRFFKLARYSPGMRSLAMVLQAERTRAACLRRHPARLRAAGRVRHVQRPSTTPSPTSSAPFRPRCGGPS